MIYPLRACLVLALLAHTARAAEPVTLPDTKPLTETGDLSAKMLDAWHHFAEHQIDDSLKERAKLWKRDFSSVEAYETSIKVNRDRFRSIIGAVDERLPPSLERFGDDDNPALVAETATYRVSQVRWTVLPGVNGEGLLLEPRNAPIGYVIALPDADQTPEQLVGLAEGVPAESQFARRLVESGWMVLVPTPISRGFEFSGNPKVAMTNQSHREWIYRQAYHMGRHVIGFEVQKVQAGVDWFKKKGGADAWIGVAGYGEGGLVALYSAAVDPRIRSTMVSGYFDSRQKLWAEPLYRNVFGLLREFGDAEIASLIAPRSLVVEYSEGPKVDGPAAPPKDRKPGAAVGKLGTPSLESVTAEFKRIDGLVKDGFQRRELVHGDDKPVPFASAMALSKFVGAPLAPSAKPPTDLRKWFDPLARQGRQVHELEDYVQKMVRGADATRDAFLFKHTTLIQTLAPRGERFRMYRVKEQSPDVFAKEMVKYRQYLHEEVLGKLEEPTVAPNPRTRQVYDRPKWVGYDVVLDVYPDVFAWGVLMVPKDLKPGEKRPVIVFQHGRNGLPKDVIEGNTPSYHNCAVDLVERGFIVFAPHNLYRGEDLYRLLNRKANTVKLTMFSFIIASHQQILNYLESLPFVDGKRMAFYGHSYGGETAVRVPPIVEKYALSICSGDFNDWARKVASTDSDYSFMFSIEWEMPYFNMGNTFNYAELSYLMVPRPFMVERGHHDGVAPDEWVLYEFGKVRWLYDQLGLHDRTTIDVFNGGHTINGEVSYDFLHRQLNWPKPGEK